MSSAIALILISSMALTLLALPNANAASTRTSYPFIDAIPNPVGVHQETLINFGASKLSDGPSRQLERLDR